MRIAPGLSRGISRHTPFPAPTNVVDLRNFMEECVERKALKGHVTTAQGNALGKKQRALSSPERAHYSVDKYTLSGLETVAGS